MSTQLELDTNLVDLDIPLVEQPEVLAFLGNPKIDEASITIPRELLYKLLLLTKNILRNKFPEWSKDKLSVTLEYEFAISAPGNENDFYFDRCSISDSTSVDIAKALGISESDNEEMPQEKMAVEQISSWISQGIYSLFNRLNEFYCSHISISLVRIISLSGEGFGRSGDLIQLGSTFNIPKIITIRSQYCGKCEWPWRMINGKCEPPA